MEAAIECFIFGFVCGFVVTSLLTTTCSGVGMETTEQKGGSESFLHGNQYLDEARASALSRGVGAFLLQYSFFMGVEYNTIGNSCAKGG
jgi:hypothetical protein